MAEKARIFKDRRALIEIMSSSNPRDQKAIGRKVEGFVKEEWDAVAQEVMYDALWAKFNQDRHLKANILSTGNRLFVEASPYDCIWGVGLALDNKAVEDSKNWKGTNWLGQALTRVRDDIRAIEGRLCPSCRGTRVEGHDRELPPNPYVCDTCKGTGRVPC